jgi:hypothetical protein
VIIGARGIMDKLGIAGTLDENGLQGDDKRTFLGRVTAPVVLVDAIANLDVKSGAIVEALIGPEIQGGRRVNGYRSI